MSPSLAMVIWMSITVSFINASMPGHKLLYLITQIVLWIVGATEAGYLEASSPTKARRIFHVIGAAIFFIYIFLVFRVSL